ncbi:MAG: CBS domain-containing protein [Solirubrobacteraceae bacterium]
MTTSIQPFQGSYLTPSFESATVADAMRAGVMGCPPDVPATMVARMMATHHIHAVVVEGIHSDAVRGEQLAWGIVSDIDLVRAGRTGLDTLSAGDLAGHEPITVEASLPITEAARLMDENGTSHLVVSDGRRPVGVISTLDIAGVLAWGRG